MPLNAEEFEILGSFYLGRPVDPATARPIEDAPPFLYDSTDLTTHAICVGMTGSGKTGLGVALLEEAAIDGIPALIIDPKGDLTNLALQFPNLEPSDFRPWISPDNAARAGETPDAFAASQAELWKKGLARWGEDGERIAKLAKSAEVAVYTPGSTAGIPVSVIQSLEAPPEAMVNDPELLGAQIETTVASLLGLLGINADPTRSREGTLLSTILHHSWDRGEGLDLPEIARRIQKPPFSQIGVLDIEAFYPEKDRFALVLALNSLLASPNFAIWRQGVPLDVQSLLYTPEGKPRLAVFSIAHLGDAERMFFVSMLLGATLSWMRRQPGTSSLRALLYMDEIFGYFPPTANPPSKKPLLTLMKQARAFGLGVVLATQNPADLDYKGLSNAGTWFIGRLQTERDKMRLLDGLAGLGVDRNAIDQMLSSLGKRIFLMNNVHENKPILFESRWALSYLCGPLTRDQIRQLPRPSSPVATTPPAQAASARREEPIEPVSTAAPMVSGIRQIYPKKFTGDALYPQLVGVATVRYRDAKAKLDFNRPLVLATGFPDSLHGVIWDEALPLVLEDFDSAPPAGRPIRWGAVPPEGLRAASYTGWQRDFAAWIVEQQTLTLLECPLNGALSEPDEAEMAFRTRLSVSLREARDAQIAAMREKYAKKEQAIEQRRRAAEERLRTHEARAGDSRLQTVISAGSTLLSLFLGRKKLSATTISRATSTAKGLSRTVKQGDDLDSSRERLKEIEAELTALNEALREEMDATRDQFDALTTPLIAREIKPTRTGTRVEWMALGWLT